MAAHRWNLGRDRGTPGLGCQLQRPARRSLGHTHRAHHGQDRPRPRETPAGVDDATRWLVDGDPACSLDGCLEADRGGLSAADKCRPVARLGLQVLPPRHADAPLGWFGHAVAGLGRPVLTAPAWPQQDGRVARGRVAARSGAAGRPWSAISATGVSWRWSSSAAVNEESASRAGGGDGSSPVRQEDLLMVRATGDAPDSTAGTTRADRVQGVRDPFDRHMASHDPVHDVLPPVDRITGLEASPPRPTTRPAPPSRPHAART